MGFLVRPTTGNNKWMPVFSRSASAALGLITLLLVSDANLAFGQSRSSRAKRTKPVASAPAATPAPLTRETLPSALANQVGAFRSVGVLIAPASGESVIYAQNQTRPFIPASNRKVFTGALALDQLGSDYRFLTTLHRTGPIQGGVIEGDLVVTPSGDPTMNSELFPGQPEDWVYQNWAGRLKGMGITSVRGSLIIDASKWDLRDLSPKGWAARIRDDSYAPKTSPLTVNSNLITVRVSPGNAGGPPVVDFVPPAAGYPVAVSARTGAGAGFRVSQGAGGRITITGTGNRATQARLPVDNPTLYAAAVLRHRLKDAGITIQGGVRVAQRPNEVSSATRDTVLAAYQSPPMHEMVRHMMKKSDNHFAEQLYVAVSHVRAGRAGYSESRQIEEEFLRRIRMPMAGFRAEDGSGLSELNLITAEGMVHVLRTMLSHPAGRHFVDSMAVSGRDGTLRGRMRDTAAVDRVRAKTGFINGVSCLSGYLTAPGSREPVTFALLFNRLDGGPGSARSTQDRMCDMIVKAYQ